MLSFFYNTALIIYSIVSLPKLIYHRIFHLKYRDSFAQKLGHNFPEILHNGREVIWVHAVSVGETKAVAPLVKMLKKRYRNPIIIVSSTTETGHTEAKRNLACADYFVYLPFDFSWIITPIVKQVRPSLVLVTETDFWFHFLEAAKQAGAVIALVNGKISETSCTRFSMLKSFSRELFSFIDVFCVQSEEYKKRFERLGIPGEKIIVSGNMKFDDDYPRLPQEELDKWKNELGIDPKDKVVVLGSTHQTEEEEILDQLQVLWRLFPRLKVLVVPRHPERFDEVAAIIESKQIPYCRLSSLTSSCKHSVILIDAMGLLRKCYQFADVAIVCGSFTAKVGGHNIIEPCSYGIPTVFGPYMHAQPDLCRLVEVFKAGIQTEIKSLGQVVTKLLNDVEFSNCYSKAGLKLKESNTGATERIGAALEKVLATQSRPF